MMQSPNMRKHDNAAEFWWLNLMWLWTLFGQRQVRSSSQVLGEIGTKNSYQVALAENNHVI